MAVASAQLAVGSVSSTTPTTIYTAPSGHRTIVKSIIVRNAGAAGVLGLTVAKAGGGASSIGVSLAASGSAGDTSNEEWWIVLNAGDQLKVTWPTASGGWWTVSGTELVL